MSREDDSYQLPPGLINLPPEILDRAQSALPPGAGIEALTALVVAALEDYLDPRARSRPGKPPASWGDKNNLLFGRMDSPPGVRPPEKRPPPGRPFGEALPSEPFSVDLEGIQRIEGPSRDVFLDSFKEIDQFEIELQGAKQAEAAGQVLTQVTTWARIEPTDHPPVPLDDEIPAPGKRAPIFGFHNRDYPSLWSLDLLAKATREEPVLWSEFAFGLSLLARKFGGLLRELDGISSGAARPPRSLKFATSFPDPRKPNEAGGGQWLLSPDGSRRERLFPFVKNNFGRIQKTKGVVQAAGPLPQWGAVAFSPEGRDYRVGVTDQGYALLRATAGASIALPHPPQATRGFIGYLKENAPEDWQGFLRVLETISEHPDRDALILENKEFFDSFKEKPSDPEDLRFASTMTQGYVSRGREWGLIAPELAPSGEGKRVLYKPTELGQEMMDLDD